MAKDDIPIVSAKLYVLLKPLTPEKRQWAIRAAFAMLGEGAPSPETLKTPEEPDNAGGGTKFTGRVKAWMKANGITDEQLGHVFHIDGETVDIIASEAPGNSGREQTINTYVLCGIGALLRTGEPKFEDKAGRDACDKLGCYQATNHATILKKHRGNVFTGSQDGGWSLTGPGLKRGAELIKGLTGE